MAQQVKELYSKPDDLSLITGTDLVEGENKLSSDLHTQQ